MRLGEARAACTLADGGSLPLGHWALLPRGPAAGSAWLGGRRQDTPSSPRSQPTSSLHSMSRVTRTSPSCAISEATGDSRGAAATCGSGHFRLHAQAAPGKKICLGITAPRLWWQPQPQDLPVLPATSLPSLAWAVWHLPRPRAEVLLKSPLAGLGGGGGA